MKKLFIMLMMAMTVLATSCKESNGILYNVTAVGDADGEVNVSFVNGSLNANGDADMQFVWSNDTTILDSVSFGEITLDEALASDNKDVKECAEWLCNDFKTGFGVEAVSGTFAFVFQGYVVEPTTKVRIPFEFEVTNREAVAETEE